MNLKWTAEKSLSLSRILTFVMMVFACISLFCIPVITEWYDAISDQKPIHVILNIALYLSAILGILALWQLFRMFGNIGKKQIFVTENVTIMRVISWCCFGVAVIWLLLSYVRLMSMFVAFTAAFAGIILRVLKNLFAMAVEMREENDYTI